MISLAKTSPSSINGVIQRLHPEAVAYQQEGAIGGLPDGGAEVPFDPREKPATRSLEAMGEELGVIRCVEREPFRFQLAAMVGGVINLTVEEHDRVPAGDVNARWSIGKTDAPADHQSRRIDIALIRVPRLVSHRQPHPVGDGLDIISRPPTTESEDSGHPGTSLRLPPGGRQDVEEWQQLSAPVQFREVRARRRAAAAVVILPEE